MRARLFAGVALGVLATFMWRRVVELSGRPLSEIDEAYDFTTYNARKWTIDRGWW